MDFLVNLGGEIMYSDATLFQEFLQWKQQNEAAQAAADRRQRLKAAERERHEDFVRSQRLDAVLMDGVSKGETWMEFVRRTAAPSDLQKRYSELQQQAGIKPGSKDAASKEAAFLKGFQMGD